MLGHINNVAWAALFETARVRFFNLIAGGGPGRGRGLIANLEINYLAEGLFPGDVAMAHGIGHIGTRSWQAFGLAIQDGKPLATCDVTIVSAGDAQAIDPAFRTLLNQWRITGEHRS